MLSEIKKEKRVWDIDSSGPLLTFLWGNWTHEEKKDLINIYLYF